MNIVSAVANLQKECDWLKDERRELREIIKQLTGIPTDVTYIHPHDVMTFFCKGKLPNASFNNDNNTFTLDGKRYKQSPHVPVRTDKYK